MVRGLQDWSSSACGAALLWVVVEEEKRDALQKLIA